MTIWWCAAGTWSHEHPPRGYDVYVLKTATSEPRVNPCPLVLRSLPEQGYLNRIGVRNPGIEEVLKNLPEVRGELVVSILGFGAMDWARLAARCDVANVKTIELNLSCPNTEHEPVGVDAGATFRAVSNARGLYRGRLGAKLPPGASEDVARACTSAGANYLALTNTLGTPQGGMSGAPLRALALDTIERICQVVDTPIVGGGGIIHRDQGDAYLDAGANELFQGTANILHGHKPEAVNE